LRLGRVLGRWARYDLIAIDEVGYVPLAELGAEFLFQVVAQRAEKPAVIVTSNLPFPEWTQVIPNPPAVQGADRPNYRSRAPHRDRHRILPLSRNPRNTPRPNPGGEPRLRAAAAGGGEEGKLMPIIAERVRNADRARYALARVS